MSAHPHRIVSFFKSLTRLDAHHRLLLSAALGLLCYILFFGHMSWGKHLILSWDFFSLCMLVLAWARIVTAHPGVVLRTARLQHTGRKWIFLFVLASACASLAAVLVLLRPANLLPGLHAGEDIALALVTVLLSWALIHTLFALYYAYLFYCRQPAAGGTALLFPEGHGEPDYWDFAYFSFVIGMTCQVSDVEIASGEVRRWALLHGILSFAFNTAVLALGINIVSGLI